MLYGITSILKLDEAEEKKNHPSSPSDTQSQENRSFSPNTISVRFICCKKIFLETILPSQKVFFSETFHNFHASFTTANE